MLNLKDLKQIAADKAEQEAELAEFRAWKAAQAAVSQAFQFHFQAIQMLTAYLFTLQTQTALNIAFHRTVFQVSIAWQTKSISPFHL